MKKKLLTALTIAMSISLSSIPVMAAEYSEDGSANCTVTAEIGSSYQVSVPATLALAFDADDDAFKGTYQVGAKGNIAGNKKVVVAPANSTITMTGKTTNETADATVTQTVTEFVLTAPTTGQAQIGTTDYAYTNGSVEVSLDKADQYEGTITFNFSLANK